ncbi:MAG: hypothetical protein DSY80_04465 [Desulfocapsa sp.]|nr:MAG: hypothetical protein DSY80_04465 [Desulfocapsa sp.]
MTFKTRISDLFYTGEIAGAVNIAPIARSCESLIGFSFHGKSNGLEVSFDFRVVEITSESRECPFIIEIFPGAFIHPEGVDIRDTFSVEDSETLCQAPGIVCYCTLRCQKIYKTYEDAAGDLVEKKFNEAQNPKFSCSEYLKTKINMGLQVTLRGKLCV